MTNSRFVSKKVSDFKNHCVTGTVFKRTKRVAGRQLWFLRVASGQLISNAVEKLDVALLWVLLERRDKCPRHGTSGLGSNSGVGPADSSQPMCYLMPRGV
jgi:hypothetical protein